jgi:amidase
LTYNPNNITTLAELRTFTRQYPPEDYPIHNTGQWDMILDEQKFNNTDPRVWFAYQQALNYSNVAGLVGTIEKYNLDAIIMPASIAPVWAATIGCPIVTVSLGFYPEGTNVINDPDGGLVDYTPGIL